MNKNNSTVTVTRANIKDLGNARPAWTVADGEERTANMHEAARDAMTYFYDNEGNALVVTADSYAKVIAGDADKFEVVFFTTPAVKKTTSATLSLPTPFPSFDI